tara:strand:+ start:3468 stop:3725 length:258 start_codon:yes stop_codon:yes gene_type:complete
LSQEVNEDENLHLEIGKLSEDTIPHRIPKKSWVINFLFGVAILSFLACALVSHAESASVASEFILFAGIGVAFLLTFYAELLRQL